jgi:hypothetical protein
MMNLARAQRPSFSMAFIRCATISGDFARSISCSSGPRRSSNAGALRHRHTSADEPTAVTVASLGFRVSSAFSPKKSPRNRWFTRS